MMKLPRSLSEVSVDFVNAALQRRWPGLEVTAAGFDGATEGTSSRAQLLLDYGHIPDGPDRPPPTMWLKSSFNDLHDVILRYDPFRIEARFYQLAGVPVVTPDCYFSDYDEERHAFLLLEDLTKTGVRFGHVSRPVTQEGAKAVLTQLARMHGGTWGKTVQFRPDWMETPITGEYSKFFLTELMDRLPRLWRGRRADLVPEDFQDIDRFRRCFAALQNGNSAGEGCLLHGDCHAGNVYYGLAEDEAGVLDWSLLRWGRWAHEIGHAFQQAGPAHPSNYNSAFELMDANYPGQTGVFDHYVEALARNGGPRLAKGEAWDAYAVQPLYGFLTWMATFPEMQGEQTCRDTVARFAAAAVDLRTCDRLAG